MLKGLFDGLFITSPSYKRSFFFHTSKPTEFGTVTFPILFCR
jgi:hypothetical protein